LLQDAIRFFLHLTPARMFGMPCGYPYSVLRNALHCNVHGLPCCQ